MLLDVESVKLLNTLCHLATVQQMWLWYSLCFSFPEAARMSTSRFSLASRDYLLYNEGNHRAQSQPLTIAAVVYNL